METQGTLFDEIADLFTAAGAAIATVIQAGKSTPITPPTVNTGGAGGAASGVSIDAGTIKLIALGVVGFFLLKKVF